MELKLFESLVNDQVNAVKHSAHTQAPTNPNVIPNRVACLNWSSDLLLLCAGLCPDEETKSHMILLSAVYQQSGVELLEGKQ